ncbi:MAG TPA: exosortase/archaeosortase family protein [bacterium]|nr:exosortase/archaeosortase family protein [bacterium]
MDNAPKISRYMPFIFLAVLVLLMLPVLPDWLKDVYKNENNQHCMAIPFISLYIVFLKKDLLTKYLQQDPPQPSAKDILLFLAGILLYFVGTAASIIYFRQVSFIIILAGAVWFVYGWGLLKELIFPVSYLLFAVPIPEAAYQAFSSPMKIFASRIAAHLIRLTGIPVYREGVNLFFPQTSVEVVDACSGMRSLISLLAVAAAFAYFFQKKPLGRGVLFLSAIPIAVLSNVIRIALTGIIAHTYGMEYAQGMLHTMLGTAIVIVIGVSGMFGVQFVMNLLSRTKA